MKMMRPVRCITCGKLLGDKYDEFEQRVKKGESPASVLDGLGVRRYCCRRMLLTSVDLMDEIMKFKR
jgi:DNA-directed RNA polymerase subunit N